MGNQQEVKKGGEKRKLSAPELQTHIMIVQAKLTQSRNKKVELIKKKRQEIIKCLNENSLDIAKAKMEIVRFTAGLPEKREVRIDYVKCGGRFGILMLHQGVRGFPALSLLLQVFRGGKPGQIHSRHAVLEARFVAVTFSGIIS